MTDHTDEGLEREATQAYRDKRVAEGQIAIERHYAAAVTAAMDAVEPGMWTAYCDLASVASTNAQTVATFVREGLPNASHRVLGKGGRLSSGFFWADNSRTDTQQEALGRVPQC